MSSLVPSPIELHPSKNFLRFSEIVFLQKHLNSSPRNLSQIQGVGGLNLTTTVSQIAKKKSQKRRLFCLNTSPLATFTSVSNEVNFEMGSEHLRDLSKQMHCRFIVATHSPCDQTEAFGLTLLICYRKSNVQTSSTRT